MAQPFFDIKSRFPIFTHWPALVYLDNAATTQKPRNVIHALNHFYEFENAPVHRGLYKLSSDATQQYEAVRRKIAQLIGAPSEKNIAFTKSTTESINIIAQGYLKKILQPGDNVVISALEHHANLIPWQQVCKQNGSSLRIIPVDAYGDLELNKLDSLLDNKTRLLAVTHISNVLGTINPVEEIISKAHKKNIPVLLDGAQSTGHCTIDVQQLDVDFFAFSAHKMYGPTGTGVLYCKEELGHQISPLNYGGGAIKNVEWNETEFLDYPFHLEAGTPNVSGVIGLGAAIDFVNELELMNTFRETISVSEYFKEKLKTLDYVEVIGKPRQCGPIVSFTVKNIHAHDVAGFLAHQHIAVRAGHHCAQPLLDSLGIPATVRASFSVYNNRDDADKTVEALVELKKFWS